MMKTLDAINYFGGVTKLATALGINRTAVYQWGNTVPKGRAYQIEVLTKGVLKAVEDASKDMDAA